MVDRQPTCLSAQPSPRRPRYAARRTSARGSTRSSGGGRRRNVPIRSSSSASAAPSDGSARAASASAAPASVRPAAPGQELARRGDAAAGDDDHPLEAVLGGGHEQAELERAQPVELRERRRDFLERRDPVAQAGRVLEAELRRQPLQLLAQRRQGVLRLAVPVAERAGRDLGAPPALQRPVGPGRVGDAPAGAAAAEVDVAVGTRAARVRRRPQLAKEPQLLEPRLQLRAEDPPLDPLERAERRLDRGPLALGAEVRAQPRAQVTGAADVEHLVVPVAEEVDAGPRRRAGDERALAREPACARRGEIDELRHRRGAALLGEADQRQQDLRRRLRVGERAVARPGRRAEEVGERGEPDALLAALEQPPREPDRVDDRRRHPPAREPLDLAVEEAHVEAGVVGDEHGVAGELEEAAHGELDRRRSPERAGVDSRQRRDRRRQRPARVHERLEALLELEPADAHGADLADRRRAGREAGRLEVEDDVGRVLERERRAGRRREPDAAAAPGEPRIAVDDVGEQRAGEPGRDVPQRIELAGRVLGGHRPVPRLDQLHEPVGGVERELHAASLGEHMFACNGKEKAATPARPSRPRKRTRC